MKKLSVLLLVLPLLSTAQSRYQKDFMEFWSEINANYAYLKVQQIDWNKVKEIYAPFADTIRDDNGFIRFLENVLNELHNGHSSLNTNLPSSNRLVPTGADLFVEKKSASYIITDVRIGSGAARCGLKPGMEVTRFNDGAIPGQVARFLPAYSPQPTPAMEQYALSMLFAGTHDRPRKVSIRENGMIKDYFPDQVKPAENGKRMYWKIIDGHTGYIRINNSLGENGLIAEFDAAIDSLLQTRNLVLDLTETPSGGNSTVARAIMGRFINRKHPYQQHEVDEEACECKRSWTEYVMPRKTRYTGRLIVLVGHWTGSMGEGIAIGFDGMKRATLVGTRMAGLIGAISGFRLSETKIGFQIPTERLYHINGSPREDYIPSILAPNSAVTQERVKKLLPLEPGATLW